MTIEAANRELLDSLQQVYDQPEAAAIANLVMERLTGESKSSWIIHKQASLDQQVRQQFNHFKTELSQGRPVQYVLGEAWFCGLKFLVDESVLIPRPETEELVSWVQAEIANPPITGDLLDIGTGSGCIAIALKKRIPQLAVSGVDISEPALESARLNASMNQVDIPFSILDILSPGAVDQLPELQYIVSNPPYIPIKDKERLPANVRDHEPGLALFVPDDNPLLFYKAIASAGNKKLIPGGKIFFEIHEDYADVLNHFFSANHFTVEIKKDIFGKSRMAKLEHL